MLVNYTYIFLHHRFLRVITNFLVVVVILPFYLIIPLFISILLIVLSFYNIVIHEDILHVESTFFRNIYTLNHFRFEFFNWCENTH